MSRKKLIRTEKKYKSSSKSMRKNIHVSIGFLQITRLIKLLIIESGAVLFAVDFLVLTIKSCSYNATIFVA